MAKTPAVARLRKVWLKLRASTVRTPTMVPHPKGGNCEIWVGTVRTPGVVPTPGSLSKKFEVHELALDLVIWAEFRCFRHSFLR